MARSRKEKGLYLQRGIYHLRTDPVTRKKLSTKCRDLDAALEFRANRERLANAPPPTPASRATLGEWVGRYWQVKLAGARSKATLGFIEGKLGQLRRVLGDDRKLETITPGTFDEYLEHRRSERGRNRDGKTTQVSDYTIVRELRELLRVLRLAKRASCFDGDLQALMPTELDARYEPRQRALPEAEVTALLEQLPTPAWRALACVIIALGCRLSEAIRLRPEDIESIVEVAKDEHGNDVEVEKFLVWIDGRKTVGASRVVPVLSCYLSLLRLAIPELPIGSISNYSRTFTIACQRAGIPTCSPNDLRRTHATLAGSRGIPDELLAKLLGHQTVAMSRRVYNRAKAVQLGPVVERMLSQAPPIELPDSLPPIARRTPGRTRVKPDLYSPREERQPT